MRFQNVSLMKDQKRIISENAIHLANFFFFGQGYWTKHVFLKLINKCNKNKRGDQAKERELYSFVL